MKRDMKVITKVLELVEDSESTWIAFEEVEVAGVKPRAIRYYVDLCVQAGFLGLTCAHEGVGRVVLTWQGHNYLEKLAQDGRISFCAKERYAIREDMTIGEWDEDGAFLVENTNSPLRGLHPPEIMERWEEMKIRAARRAFRLPSDAEVYFFGIVAPYPSDFVKLDWDSDDPEVKHYQYFLDTLQDEWDKEWEKCPIDLKTIHPYEPTRIGLGRDGRDSRPQQK